MNITPIEESWIKENLQNIDFLKMLTAEQVDSLIKNVKPRLLLGNQAVIQEGERGSSFFLIYNGKVAVSVERRGKRVKLATLQKGDYFGEISLLTGKPATAHVVSNGPGKVFFLDGIQFADMVKANQVLRDSIIAIMKKRLTERKSAIHSMLDENLMDIQSAIKDFLTASPAAACSDSGASAPIKTEVPSDKGSSQPIEPDSSEAV